jgi:hypothetical protein
MGTEVTLYVTLLFIFVFFSRAMTDEISDLTAKSTETKLPRRRNKNKSETGFLPPSKKLTSRRSIFQWFTSYFTSKSPDKIDVISNNNNDKKEYKKGSTKSSWLCQNLCCKLFLFFCAIYLIMYLRPDYSIYVRNSFEDILKRWNLTSEELQLRPGQRLSQYRQPSMPIIIIPGIISTGLELWQGTECTTGKFRQRFWTSMQMVDNIGRDHQCWLKHLSLNLSTWYIKTNNKHF